MGDVVGDLAHRRHQPLDLIEHPIEIGGEQVELVAGAVERHAIGQISGHDPLAGAVDQLDPAQQVAAHRSAAEQADAERHQPGPQQGQLDPVAERRRIADVAADQEAIAAGDDDQAAARRMGLDPALDPGFDARTTASRCAPARPPASPRCCRQAAARRGSVTRYSISSPRSPALRAAMIWTSPLSPRWAYCSASPVISASRVASVWRSTKLALVQ